MPAQVAYHHRPKLASHCKPVNVCLVLTTDQLLTVELICPRCQLQRDDQYTHCTYKLHIWLPSGRTTPPSQVTPHSHVDSRVMPCSMILPGRQMTESVNRDQRCNQHNASSTAHTSNTHSTMCAATLPLLCIRQTIIQVHNDCSCIKVNTTQSP